MRAHRPQPFARRVLISVQAISWVIEHSRHKGNSFVVLLMIANHARSDGTGAWPSIGTIAKESRISDRTVQRTIKRLSRYQNGFETELCVHTGKGPHGCNMYSLPGVKLSPQQDRIVHEGVSDSVRGGVTSVSPEPSLEPSLIQPSLNHSLLGFEMFWEAYPKKVEKISAKKEFEKIRGVDFKTIVVGLERWKAYWKASATDPKYIPYPAKFLKNRKWEDDVPVIPQKESEIGRAPEGGGVSPQTIARDKARQEQIRKMERQNAR